MLVVRQRTLGAFESLEIFWVMSLGGLSRGGGGMRWAVRGYLGLGWNNVCE